MHIISALIHAYTPEARSIRTVHPSFCLDTVLFSGYCETMNRGAPEDAGVERKKWKEKKLVKKNHQTDTKIIRPILRKRCVAPFVQLA
jgi:hypothetical protein